MKIGIPKEIKNHEYRVGATPAMVLALTKAGHEVLVETNAGKRINFSDEHYRAAGAIIVETAKEAYAADMVIKVKEPQKSEFAYFREGLILFCFLHLAAEPELTKELLRTGVTALAYETVTDSNGRLPLLIPMSEIAGRIAIQVGATYLQLNHGGKGILLGGAPGILPAKVTIIGGGAAGSEAARSALGFGAQVTLLDRSMPRLRELNTLYGPALRTLYSSPQTVEEAVVEADLVVGAVLIPAQKAPKLITHAMVKKMEPGSVIVDVSIDQGGCSETSRPTTHTDPAYVVDGVTHYCVTNMPGACAKTATLALTNASFEFILQIASKGLDKAIEENPYLAEGVNIRNGNVVNASLAHDLKTLS